MSGTYSASRGFRLRAAILAFLLLAVSGESAAATGTGAELPPRIARAAASLDSAGVGARLGLPFHSGASPLGMVAGPDGVRALLHYQSSQHTLGPRTTAFSLASGGSFFAPASAWGWLSGERGSFEIEVYGGSLAAFRVVEGRVLNAEVVERGGLWSVYGPRQLRWGLLLWMAVLGGGILLLARKTFRLPVSPAWGILLLTIALVPVLPAMSTARLLGPFDLQARVLPWNGPRGGPSFEPATPHLGDISNHLVPWQIEARRQLLAGQAPLLNQRVGGGQALLGNGQSAPFSFLSIASLPFEPPVAQALRAFLKVLLALLGTFIASRLLGVREGFALAGALGYAFGGSMSVWKLHPHTEVMALWPWLFIAVESLIRGDRERRPGVLAGVALSGMLLAGHPETAAMALGAAGVRWGWEWAFGGWRSSRPGFVRFLAACIVATSLTAMAVLPLAETIATSMKLGENVVEGPPWQVRPPGLKPAILIHLVAPGVFGTWQDGSFQGTGSFPQISEGAVGLVLFALALAALPLMRWRRPRQTYLPLLALGGLSIHLLPFGLDQLWASLPGIANVSPRYAGYLAGFALALLGSLGLEQLVSSASSSRRRAALVLGLGGGISLAVAPLVARALTQLDALPGWVARLQPVSWQVAAWTAAAATAPLFVGRLRLRPALVAAVCATLVVGQLGTAYHDYIPTVHSALAYPEVPLLDAVGERADGRVIGTRGVMVPNIAAAYGLDDVRAHDPTTWQRYDRWLARVLDAERGGQIAHYKQIAADHRAPLAAMAVRYLVAARWIWPPPPWRDRGSYGGVRLWARDGDARWAFFPREVVGVGSAEEAFSLSRMDREPEHLAPLEAESIAAGARARSAAEVADVERRSDRVRVRVSVLEDSWLVVSQTAIPGWQATIDGRPTPIGLAYGTLAAVRVPAGARLVELRYRPLGWRLGAPVSSATAILLLAGLSVSLWRGRRR